MEVRILSYGPYEIRNLSYEPLFKHGEIITHLYEWCVTEKNYLIGCFYDGFAFVFQLQIPNVAGILVKTAAPGTMIALAHAIALKAL